MKAHYCCWHSLLFVCCHCSVWVKVSNGVTDQNYTFWNWYKCSEIADSFSMGWTWNECIYFRKLWQLGVKNSSCEEVKLYVLVLCCWMLWMLESLSSS